ncbi:hypothetical protein C5615_38180 [Burkholderia cepacia]|uniref:Uncharacterized protein n=1 Tax=Burkholderia cepacia TaxID=292 RepID=A0A2S8HWR7_BURCE|nr:hypothetical protein C5615_38180 [Burkholderia cepacia]
MGKIEARGFAVAIRHHIRQGSPLTIDFNLDLVWVDLEIRSPHFQPCIHAILHQLMRILAERLGIDFTLIVLSGGLSSDIQQIELFALVRRSIGIPRGTHGRFSFGDLSTTPLSGRIPQSSKIWHTTEFLPVHRGCTVSFRRKLPA